MTPQVLLNRPREDLSWACHRQNLTSCSHNRETFTHHALKLSYARSVVGTGNAYPISGNPFAVTGSYLPGPGKGMKPAGTVPPDPFESFASGDSSFYTLDPIEQAKRDAKAMRRAFELSQPTTSEVYKTVARDLKEQPVQYVGGKNPQATVAVLDHFGDGDLDHGEAVTEVLKRAAGLDDSKIQRIENIDAGEAVVNLGGTKGPDSAEDRLNGYIELSGYLPLAQTNKALGEIANDPQSKIKTVSQSQGLNRIGMFKILQQTSFDFEGEEPGLTESGKLVFEGLGIKPELSSENMRAFYKKSLSKIDDIFSNSPRIQDAKKRHVELSKQLRDQGVAYVVSAGNDGQELRDFQENAQSTRMPDSFDDDLFANAHNISVGALDDKGTADTGDDTIADFSSDHDQVDFLAQGVAVPVTNNGSTIFVDGTSFAAPFVSGKMAGLRREAPKASSETLEQQLRALASAPVKGSPLPVIR